MAISISVRTDSRNGPARNGARMARARVAAASARRAGAAGRIRVSGGGFGAGGGQRAAEQAVGADDEHDGHDDECQHKGGLRQQEDAEGLQQGDQQAGEIGAGQAAEAADHDDDEGVGDDGEVQLQVGGAVGKRQRAAEAGEAGAEGEDQGEQQALIDAEGGDHLAVLGGGADQGAPAGAGEQQPQHGQDDGADGDHQQVVERDALAGDFDEGAQPAGAGEGQVVGAPDHQGQVLDDQDDAEGGQQLQQFGRFVDAAK